MKKTILSLTALALVATLLCSACMRPPYKERRHHHDNPPPPQNHPY